MTGIHEKTVDVATALGWLETFAREELRLRSVDRKRNLLDQGATSLKLARLVVEVEDRFGVELGAEVFMAGATLDAVAREIAESLP